MIWDALYTPEKDCITDLPECEEKGTKWEEDKEEDEC